MFEVQTTLNCKGTLLDLSRPRIMGILNTTPDSFFDGGVHNSVDAALAQAEKMLKQGADLLDVGGMSSRPGAELIDADEELRRVIPVLEALHQSFPEALLSIDTFRGKVARAAVDAGACMINDISAGSLDSSLLPTVLELQVPYVLMHMQGAPKTMQQKPEYKQVVEEVFDFLNERMQNLRAQGLHDIVLDPGFGFGKSLSHNYQLLKNLHIFKLGGAPVLAGISRKSMICKALGVNPGKALNGTTALHMVALQQGANILRVHDVKEAAECIRLYELLENPEQAGNT